MAEKGESQSPSTSTDSEGGNSERPTGVRGPRTRRLKDWLDSFLESTADAPSPERFRLWAGITALAGAAERRVWTRTGKSWQTETDVFPNLYTLLVAPPGIGKGQAIGPVERIWRKAKGEAFGRLRVAPLSMTKASLVDEMLKSQRRVPRNKFIGQDPLSLDIEEYASLCILAEELGVLISSHDLDFLSVLTDIYNNKPIFSETRRVGKIDITVLNPQITFLGGTQPAFLASILPDEAWGMGAMSRIIMVYSGQGIKKNLFPTDIFSDAIDFSHKKLQKDLEVDIGQIYDLYGGCRWDKSAMEAIVSWIAGGMEPAPTHSKLLHYASRRELHIIKLSMVAALSRSNDLSVSVDDFERAKGWLLDVEAAMPDAFREMVGKSDGELIKELHWHVVHAWLRGGKKPLHTSFLWNFLYTRTTADRIQRTIDAAEKANVLARIASTETWIPRRPEEHGNLD